ncbi:MAG: mechanosensitive ion channel [Nitrospinaceae bacterium]|nr:mechanosensitive ion channel family protein [Nitrospinaceae bacterium]NIR57571.1 mechanosensitive ion channel family protein [Nitrospinaceae bacterium]NIS88041.1 mechanosensitive ion channel family protein [Nitrospinaceae bacterium]NIT84905.1 mechanosensitive ion channel family protein [Nitrospinaceae bacterium]NIU47081.1 mechanosensitive ion channel family protein [Nitrospinaceae bacterium]
MEFFSNIIQYLSIYSLNGVLAVALFAFWLIFRSYILRRPLPESPKPKKTLETLKGLTRRTRWYFILILSLYIGFYTIKFPIRARATVDQVFFLTLLLQIGLWGTWWLKYWASATFKEAKEKDSARATAIGILKILGQSILWSLLVLAGLANMGFDITTLVAGLGVGGIAIALASQKILGDLFASLTLILDKPFVVGDFIITGEVRGNIEAIGIKTTRIRSLDGELLIMPNSDILESRIQNFKVMEKRRALLTLGVVYPTPLEKLQKISGILKEIIEAYEEVQFDRVHFKEYGPYSLNYEAVYFVNSPKYKTYISYVEKINLDIYERFKKEGIQFAYPTQTLYIDGTSTSAGPFKSGTKE